MEIINNKLEISNKKSKSSAKISHFKKIISCENKLDSLRKSQYELKVKKAVLNESSIEMKLNHLQNSLKNQNLDTYKINNLLHQLFSTINIDIEARIISFYWKQGGQTNIKIC